MQNLLYFVLFEIHSETMSPEQRWKKSREDWLVVAIVLRILIQLTRFILPFVIFLRLIL